MSLRTSTARQITLRWLPFLAVVLAFIFVAPSILSDFQLNLLGRFLTYAIVALGLDLIWGYTGMLSLGQGLFFGLGAYCFAMYLKLEQSGAKLPEFMGLYGVTELPALWQPFHSPIFAIAAAIIVPMLIATVLGYMVFRSRVQGVYFSIITQALTAIVSLLLIGQQQLINGTNGLTDLSTIFGYSLQERSTELALYVITVLALAVAFILCRWLIESRFGRLLVAVRDDESRVRFAGYNPVAIKVRVFALSAGLAGLAGVLFVPQVGIISPASMGIVPSIEIVIWVAVGGRGTLVGAVLGAILVNAGKSAISTAYPDIWQLFMGLLFIGVVLLFPDGLLGFARSLYTKARARTQPAKESPAAVASREADAADIRTYSQRT
ncbi:MAG: urea ABC transporter permease subunit UrtC [Anaerolineae bacterium]|nr:urea ABC transporter permease subunit UrtC [Anaerolineae bacterium]